MVKILNGEIVADDDPRLQQRRQPQNEPGRPHGAPNVPTAPDPRGGVGGGTGFNPNAPPLRLVDPAPGMEPLFGLPDLEVFGVRVTPYAILAAVGLGMFMGWRGVAIALVLYYVYLANQGARPAAPGQGQGQGQGRTPTSQGAGAQAAQAHQHQQQQQPGNSPVDFLTRYLNGPQPSSRSRAANGPTGSGSSGYGAQAGGDGFRAAGSNVGESNQAGQESAGGAGAGAGWAAFQGKGNKLGK